MSTLGNTARYEQEQTDIATAEVERYVERHGDLWRPRFAFDMDALVVRKCPDYGRDPERTADKEWVMWQIRSLLARRCNPGSRHGLVTLDTDGDIDNYRTAWMSASHSHIVFTSLEPGDQGLRDLAGFDAEGMAVFFDPLSMGTESEREGGLPEPVKQNTSRFQVMEERTGNWPSMPFRLGDKIIRAQIDPNSDADEPQPLFVPNVKNPSGYLGVVGFFGSLPATLEAIDDLRDAVLTLRRPPESDERPDDDDTDVEVPVGGTVDMMSL